MLKRIHFVQPCIKYNEYKVHEQKVDRLKRQIQTGNSRLSMMHAARDLIVQTSNGTGKDRYNVMQKKFISSV